MGGTQSGPLGRKKKGIEPVLPIAIPETYSERKGELAAKDRQIAALRNELERARVAAAALENSRPSPGHKQLPQNTSPSKKPLKRSALYLKLQSYNRARHMSSKDKASRFTKPSKEDREVYNELCGLDSAVKNSVMRAHLLDAGLLLDDKRVEEVYANLDRLETLDIWELTIFLTQNMLVNKALKGGLAISNFSEFCKDIDAAFERTKGITTGNVASYIPSLARADPEVYAAAVCSVSGQQYSVGDADTRFCVQSCSKPITYCIACKLNGSETVHEHIGKEPSGRNFNERVLMEPKGIPHNPVRAISSVHVQTAVTHACVYRFL